MTKSYLWLYENAPIDEDTPAWVEGLDGDHSPLGSAFPISDFMPFEPALDVTIRIDMDGYSYMKDKKGQVFNYCSVTYDDSCKTWYYFVRSAKWRANNILALVLHMDVVNSLLKTDDLSTCMDSRTLIERQHENRFVSLNVKNNAIDYVPKVDKISEGLGHFNLEQTHKEMIVDDSMPTDALKASSWTIFYGKSTTKEDAEYELLVNPVIGDTDSFDFVPIAAHPEVRFLINSSRYLNLQFSPAVKIVEVPYFPYERLTYHSDGNYFTSPGLYGYDTSAGNTSDYQSWISYKGYNSLKATYRFLLPYGRGTRVLNNEIPLIPSPLKYGLDKNYLEQERYIIDTKLMHSDFYSSRFVYDAFSFSPAFERVVFKNSDPHCKIFYTASAEPSSAISFEFSEVDYSYRKTSDFENVIISTRNNEWTIISDPYINYLRNGYNYDMKTKALNTISSLVVQPALGSLTSIITPALGVIGGVSGLINGIKNVVGNEISMSQKLAEEASKSVSVSGCDNFSVSHSVSGNKLWHFVYQLPSIMENMVDDLFYYYGYKRGYQGVPNATSRKWFNFVQCEAKWKPTFARSSKPFLDELTQKFRNGVTFFHYNEVSSKPSWMSKQGYDLDQKSENWETIITGV